MGYAQTLPYTSLEIGSINSPGVITLTTIATDTDFNQAIQIPTWAYSQMKKAFLRLEVPMEVNTSAVGSNWTLGTQYIGVDVDGGGTYQNCLIIPSASLPTPLSTTAYSYTRFIGDTDLLPLGATPSNLMHFRWKLARSLRDNLELWNLKFSLQCILGA